MESNESPPRGASGSESPMKLICRRLLVSDTIGQAFHEQNTGQLGRGLGLDDRIRAVTAR